MSKIVAVFGATGAQGGSFLTALLADPSKEFVPRALTRDVNSEKAKALAAKGIEVHHADLDHEESLKKALHGCYGAFAVTNFWEHMDAAREKKQIRHIAYAAHHNKLQHVVWSTLEDTRKVWPVTDPAIPHPHGYNVPHFDAKGESNAEFEKLGVPTTFYHTSYYWENLCGMMPLNENQDGSLTFLLPMGDVPMAGVSTVDIGRGAYTILKNRDKYINKNVGIAGEFLTGAQMAETLGAVLGKKVNYVSMPFPAYRALGFPGADDLGNMFQYYHDFAAQCSALRDLTVSKEISPSLINFKTWATQNKEKIGIKKFEQK